MAAQHLSAQHVTAQHFTVYDLILRNALVSADRPAIIQGDATLSFGQYRQRVDALAAGLAGHGLAKGERICILAQNDAAYLELYGACARQGLIAYPINWRLTAEEIARVVQRAAPRLFVVDAASLPQVADWPVRHKEIPYWYQLGGTPAEGFTPLDRLYLGSADVPVAEVTPDDPFAVISTAAVDVIPRGAVLTHGNVVMANLNAMHMLAISPGDAYLVALPLYHISALGSALVHMHAGAVNVVMPRFDAAEAVRLIDRHKITHLSDFPPVLAQVLEAAEQAGSRLPSLKIVSGLDAPATIEKLHRNTQAQFWTGFGQSETTGFVTIQRVAEHPGTAGRPSPVAAVRVVDEYDRDVALGTPGEILVRGPLVFQGYYAQPDVTEYTLRGGWHHTGDVGKFDAQGYLTYVKRKAEKELIKPGGENVYPAEVETVIMQLGAVGAVCVFGVADAQWGEAIKAVVELRPGQRLTGQELGDHVGAKIARFKRPKFVEFVASLPRTPEGGVDREAVKARWGKAG